MNRAERRRQQRQEKKQAVYQLTDAQIQKIKDDAVAEAANRALLLTFCIPVLVIHDNFGSLIRREVNGLTREERFADLLTEYYSMFNDGKFTLDDMKKDMYDLTGITFVEGQ